MRAGIYGNLRWRAANVFAVENDFRPRGCRGEIALYLFFRLLHPAALRGGRRILWRWRGVRSRRWLSCNRSYRRWPTLVRVRCYQGVQLLSLFAFVIHVVDREAVFLSSRVEAFSLGQRNASGVSRFDGATDAVRRLVIFTVPAAYLPEVRW
jgi:hypothetical protein